MKNKNNTEILNKKLLKSENIKEFIERYDEDLRPSEFCYSLYKIVEAQNITISKAMELAMINPSYGYQIFNGRRIPSRDKVIQLALGIGISLEATNRLLKLSEKSSLYVRSKRDAIFMFALNQKMSLLETEEILIESKCTPLMG